MKLRIVLARFSPAVDDVVIHSWHKSTGDTVSYGDPLCDVVVREITKMRRPISAIARKKQTVTYGKLDVSVRYRVTSIDSGVLRSIDAPAGEIVEVGAVLGVIESASGHGEGDARIVVNLVKEAIEH